MSSLRRLIGEAWSEICNGVAWVAIYKDGRSWQAEAFYPEAGDHENGYVLSEDDYREVERIQEIDHMAICINGFYQFGLKDFTFAELEEKILYFYQNRLCQLNGDFIGGLVIPLAEATRTVDGIIASATDKSNGQRGSVKELNKYYKTSDGFFDFYVNVKTGAKKFRLDKDDICVERKLDDFCR